MKTYAAVSITTDTESNDESSLLNHDLTQMMPRPVRGEQGAGTGGGVVNPLMRLPRSNLLTVGYRIRNGYLERLVWPLTDAVDSVEPTIQTTSLGGFAPFAVP